MHSFVTAKKILGYTNFDMFLVLLITLIVSTNKNRIDKAVLTCTHNQHVEQDYRKSVCPNRIFNFYLNMTKNLIFA